MKEVTLRVTHDVGLHARPASLFVQTAAKFSSTIRVKNLTTNSEFVDAKSIIMVLTLGVMKNHEIVLIIEGVDEDDAMRALISLIEHNFNQT
ncbi:MAG: HPr family phosphocarrier protein [Chloroflexota bacterium]